MIHKVKNYLLLRIEHFSPAIVMGIGISGAILYEFPFEAHWLKVLGIIIWGVALGVFVVSSIAIILRVTLFPGQFTKIMLNGPQSAFCGCIPMGFATIINMIHNIWGEQAWVVTYVMWWIDVALSLYTGWGIVFIMFAKHTPALEALNATILLPVVPLVVSSATGALIAVSQPESLRPSSIIVNLLLLLNGELLALACITSYINRLLLSRLPDRALTISFFLPVGPLGQGTFSLLNITIVASDVLLKLGVSPEVVQVLRYCGVFMGLALMGFGCFWMAMGIMALIYHYPKGFSLGWWALTFPLGTYVFGWYRLADETGLYVFKVLGALFGVLEVLNMLVCTCGTVYYGLFHSTIFKQAEREIKQMTGSTQEPSKRDEANV